LSEPARFFPNHPKTPFSRRMSAVDTPTPSSSTSDISFVGRRVGKYEIVRVVARGGMGTVYEAINKDIGKRVAMKFVDAELARNKESVARFQREAEAASAVESGHIVTIFDSGSTDDGLPFLVMELCRGEDLGHRLRKVGRLELDAALDITAQILRGLCRAHEAGIVHRDLKPDNVFLTEQDDGSTFVKILDFGISKMRRGAGAIDKTITKQGTVLGTPFYMSPEQAQALPDVDERTDLWSVGAILYEALTGKPPHEGHSYEQVIVHICTKDVLDVRVHNPGVPDKLAEYLKKALCRDRSARFQTAREMLEGLGEASDGLLSSKALRISGGRQALGSSSGVTVTPTPLGERDRDVATAPTVEANAGHPSRVGWSTSNGATVHADRRKIVAGVGLVAVLGLGVAALATRNSPSIPNDSRASATDTDTTVAPKQEPPKVAPVVTNSALEQVAAPTINTADVAPAPTEEKPATNKATAGPGASTKAGPGKEKTAAVVPVKPSATAATTAEPKPTATTPGVAPQLKLKEE
jgi:eukaryotic-like serine/threonine-protein kinase